MVPPVVVAQQPDTGPSQGVGARDAHSREGNTSKKPKLRAEEDLDVSMFPAQPQGQVPETFNIATPRRSSVPSSPNSPTTPATSVRSRSPPRELPGEAGNTTPSDVAGEGGMEVETGGHKISGISDELLTKFVEGENENVIADVVDFLDTCLSPEERHMARLQEIEKLEEVFKAFTPHVCKCEAQSNPKATVEFRGPVQFLPYTPSSIIENFGSLFSLEQISARES